MSILNNKKNVKFIVTLLLALSVFCYNKFIKKEVSTPSVSSVAQKQFTAQHKDRGVKITHAAKYVKAKINHVLRMDINSKKTGFKGCHSKIALDHYVATHPHTSYALKNKRIDSSNNGVYIAKPIITLEDGRKIGKLNNRGVSSFFPDDWNETKILNEVTHAVTNNLGKIPSRPNGNEYYGFSKDGAVEIHFYLKSNGAIATYFPVKK